MLHKSLLLFFYSQFYQINNFGMCDILYQSSPLPTSHRFFNAEQPRIVKTSSEVRCWIPSGRDLNASHSTISFVRRDCGPLQISSGKDTSPPQRLIHKCSKARLKGSFGNPINFRKSDSVKV